MSKTPEQIKKLPQDAQLAYWKELARSIKPSTGCWKPNTR